MLLVFPSFFFFSFLSASSSFFLKILSLIGWEGRFNVYSFIVENVREIILHTPIRNTQAHVYNNHSSFFEFLHKWQLLPILVHVPDLVLYIPCCGVGVRRTYTRFLYTMISSAVFGLCVFPWSFPVSFLFSLVSFSIEGPGSNDIVPHILQNQKSPSSTIQ